MASRLHIDMFLDRLPGRAVGRQQQRVALARALAKGRAADAAGRTLVNLDYKLREELREELTQLFAAGNPPWSTPPPSRARPCCWAATPPCWTKELLQCGPTAEVFHAPNSLRVAAPFSATRR